jgi:N-acetylglutamate synthase-like GNAT family acetyltransferase
MEQPYPVTPDAGAATIRRARSEEASLLSDLSLRSKAYWGYDTAFMEACREDLRVSAEEILAWPVYVLEARGRVIGYYELRPNSAEEVLLLNLFVEPDAIGHGYGKRLWLHALDTARSLGYRSLVLHSEPYAEGFYRTMGAERAGEVPSSVFPGRLLPLMRVALS